MNTKEQRLVALQDRDPIALTAKYSIRPYVARIPNRMALGIPMTEKATFHLVSLPFLRIQERAA